jgi:hypothetical protein
MGLLLPKHDNELRYTKTATDLINFKKQKRDKFSMKYTFFKTKKKRKDRDSNPGTDLLVNLRI